VVVTTVGIVGPVTGIIAGGSFAMWQFGWNLYSFYQSRRTQALVSLPEFERPAIVRSGHLQELALVKREDGWGLRIQFLEDRGYPWDKRSHDKVFTGPEALRLAGKLLPAINDSGGSKLQVKNAVKLVGDAGTPEALFRQYATHDENALRENEPYGTLRSRPAEVRLALEMAAHEEQERRAMEGELALLEAAWREAEEIAKIADELLLPERARRLDDVSRED
jgi:hypothetical protein